MSTVRPGPALYFDNMPESEPQACEVFEAGGELWARFPRTASDDGAEIPISEMPGLFEQAG